MSFAIDFAIGVLGEKRDLSVFTIGRGNEKNFLRVELSNSCRLFVAIIRRL